MRSVCCRAARSSASNARSSRRRDSKCCTTTPTRACSRWRGSTRRVRDDAPRADCWSFRRRSSCSSSCSTGARWSARVLVLGFMSLVPGSALSRLVRFPQKGATWLGHHHRRELRRRRDRHRGDGLRPRVDPGARADHVVRVDVCARRRRSTSRRGDVVATMPSTCATSDDESARIHTGERRPRAACYVPRLHVGPERSTNSRHATPLATFTPKRSHELLRRGGCRSSPPARLAAIDDVGLVQHPVGVVLVPCRRTPRVAPARPGPCRRCCSTTSSTARCWDRSGIRTVGSPRPAHRARRAVSRSTTARRGVGVGAAISPSPRAHRTAVCTGRLVVGTKPYSSGWVQTGGAATDTGRVVKPGFTFRYGHVDVRFKEPAGKGLWPAIWLAADGGPGAPQSYPWPPEIDLLESYGNPDDMVVPRASRRDRSTPAKTSSGRTRRPAFHTVSLDWRADQDHVVDRRSSRLSRTRARTSRTSRCTSSSNLATGGATGRDRRDEACRRRCSSTGCASACNALATRS